MKRIPMLLIFFSVLSACEKESKDRYLLFVGWPESPACSWERSRIIEVKTFSGNQLVGHESLEYDDQHRLVKVSYLNGSYDVWQYQDSNVVFHQFFSGGFKTLRAYYYFDAQGHQTCTRQYFPADLDSNHQSILNFYYYYNSKDQVVSSSLYELRIEDGFQPKRADTCDFVWEGDNLMSDGQSDTQYDYFPNTDGRLKARDAGVPGYTHRWIYNPTAKFSTSKNLVKHSRTAYLDTKYEYLFDASGRIKAEKREFNGTYKSGVHWVYYRYKCF